MLRLGGARAIHLRTSAARALSVAALALLACDGGRVDSGPADGAAHRDGSAAVDAALADAAAPDDAAIPVDASTPPAPDLATPADPYAQYRQQCVDKINALRATRSLPAYQRWSSAERCVDQQATHDESVNIPHDAFAHGNPACGGNGQNECPGWGAASIESCLQQMWDERNQPGCSGCDACDTFTIFQGACPNCTFNGATVCGHYVNMSSASFSTAACGFSTDGSWAAINFQ